MKLKNTLFVILVVGILIPFGGVIAGNEYMLEFDGDDSFFINDDSNQLDVNDDNAWTIECWIYPSEVPGSGTFPAIIDRKYSFGFYLRNTSGNCGLGIVALSGGGTGFDIEGTCHSGTSYMSINDWHHVAASYDGTTTRLFIDGSIVSTSTDVDFDLDASVSAVNVAARNNYGYERYFSGALDEIRYSKSARYSSAFTISTSEPEHSSDDDTIFLLHLNSGSGTSITDASSNFSGISLRSSTNDATWRAWDFYGTDLSLPVELTYFKGKSTSKGIALSWETASEIENQGFIIERKMEGAQASKLMTSYLKNPALEGAGSTTSSSQYSWIDTDVKPGSTYYYTLSDVDYQGSETRHKALKVTYTEPEEDTKPLAFQVSSIYPNPFNPSTSIQLNLDEAATLSLSIYNAKGQLVESLVQNQDYSAGEHTLNWHAGAVSSGIYFVQISSGADVLTQKVMKLD
ncbi:MAG: T9SS type A sorting domain-containing protein [Candidatus Marinimicrobia bacterium]|jgi:hypothetical protein|nr:T9SS type A sorting domain-containing protein [Candidatus Neomarinimicrobiota bacterium]MBT4033581.1 T9SS type A sorting domain-containing protein [Candidatus Neomarinimicrobiota bacterium]MBT4359932.1 T9SS type A sorting domain-containing protein [Candidatus Neomarinimicrobiota bacterium]MBT4715671.1 T9SS type A sorting domain-containing protein [Candidatus Neomarinimicrobiota bacterium]MBT4945457.1 T9SS type A sorting domain-containing protein [Candidatus Neomarinimicrobiota bacterium]